jgi:hypothetical protein
MAFTKALYYPWIDIRNEGWLKNAMLYWEKIQTIVPISIRKPYKTKTAQEFFDAGLLEPFRVESQMIEIEELTNDVLEYLRSPEGAEVLLLKPNSNFEYIHNDKVSMKLRSLVNLHSDKLADEISFRMSQKIFSPKSGKWLMVDPRFADFYMTLLATHLSGKIGAGLLTDSATNNKLATTVRLNANPVTLAYLRRDSRDILNRIMRRSLAQGMLADLILERINIPRDTPIRKILKFRSQYQNELGRFRTKIDKLTNAISTNQPLEAIRQNIEDIYINEVKPALSSLKEGLKDCEIKWATKDILKIACVSTGSTAIPLLLLGLAVPQALLAQAGVSLTLSAILYNRKKAKLLRENPYSYLLAVKEKFAR